jgi:GT2 family glycosyltransferase
MVSIIIAVRFRPDLTRACIESVLKFTDNYELILVHEGEDEEIQKLLKGYNATYVQNKEPKGFAGAMNTGLAVAKGEFVCFLNNDTVVIPGWMDEMLKAFDDKTVGLVAPTIGGVTTLQSIDQNKGQRFDLFDDPFLAYGICYVLRKSLLDKIGGFDESFGLGGGEDNDLCVRVTREGLLICIARRSFIYHYGSASFRELYNNDKTIIQQKTSEQVEKFIKKYGHDFGLKTGTSIHSTMIGDTRMVKIV